MIEALNNLWIAFENENLDPVIVKKLIIEDWDLTKKLAQRVNLLFRIVCGWEAYSLNIFDLDQEIYFLCFSYSILFQAPIVLRGWRPCSQGIYLKQMEKVCLLSDEPRFKQGKKMINMYEVSA